MDTLWNEKSVLITGVSTFQGRVYIRRLGQLIIGTFESVHIIKVSTCQGFHKEGFNCPGIRAIQHDSSSGYFKYKCTTFQCVTEVLQKSTMWAKFAC